MQYNGSRTSLSQTNKSEPNKTNKINNNQGSTTITSKPMRSSRQSPIDAKFFLI